MNEIPVIKVEKSEVELQALNVELERLNSYIENIIKNPNNDYLLKYSGADDPKGLQCERLRCSYDESWGRFDVWYTTVGENEQYKGKGAPPVETAFMLRDVIFDFNPTVPVKVTIPSAVPVPNINIVGLIEFVVWPNKEKVTHLCYFLDSVDHPEILEGLDKF